MARQIGKMLNAREPKIVNGPQILDKYVGESEANIRKLFIEAEEEEKRVWMKSLAMDCALIVIDGKSFSSPAGSQQRFAYHHLR